MRLELDVPKTAFSALRHGPEGTSSCLLVMAAAKMYEIGKLSQEEAAELAGQSRQDFLMTLSRLRVSPFQGIETDLTAVGLGARR